MTTHPQILLLARPGLLDNEAALAEAICQHGYPLAVVRSTAEFLQYLEQSPAAQMIAVVQQRSVIEHLQDRKSEFDFMRSYADTWEASKGWRQLALLMISIPIKEIMWMHEYGDLVTAFINDPVQPQELVHMADHIIRWTWKKDEDDRFKIEF